MTRHITVPLPDNTSINQARRIAVECETAVNRATGALVDATVTDLTLTEQERRVLCKAFDVAQDAIGYAVCYGATEPLDAETAHQLADLRARLDPDSRYTVTAHHEPELTRPQETAADAMAGEYGRSKVRRLGDGAVVITGMTGEFERRSVCVERDGRERWRS